MICTVSNIEIHYVHMGRKYFLHATGRTLLLNLDHIQYHFYVSSSQIWVPLHNFQISPVFSEYTKYNILNEHEVRIIIQDFGTVQKVCGLDPYYSSSNIPKYIFLYTRFSYKNTKEKYTSELPTSDCTQYYKFFNIYYEEDDDIPRCC